MSRCTYGRPRIHAELRADGERVGGKRVARLMRRAGLQGISRRRRVRTTRRSREARPVPDLVERDFSADRPDRLWVADITLHPYVGGVPVSGSRCGRLQPSCCWLDDGDPSGRTELVLEALNMAISQRRPEQVIHHSDQGTQYTSIAFGLRCKRSRRATVDGLGG